MLFDVHCHLTFPEFGADREDVIERARAAGVSIINSTVKLEEVEAASELSKKFENVYWTLGLSASELDEGKVEAALAAVRARASEIIGVGEVGLDYYWIKDDAGREKEKINFKKFIEVAVELDLPLVVHSRDAEEDVIAMLARHEKPALLHCFSGSVEQALEAVKLGCLISIPTNVAYVKSRQKLAREVPLENMVLETDAPYLAPEPKTRNEPANVARAAEKIAELKGASVEEVAEATTRSAQTFFNLKDLS